MDDDYTVDRNLWLKLGCLDPTRKDWLTEEERFEQILELQSLAGSNVAAESVRLVHGLSLDVDDPIDVALAYREKMSKLKTHKKLKMDAASMTFDELVSWEKEESLSHLLRTPPLKPRKIGIEFLKYEDVYGGGCFDVGGSFKGFDWIDEPVGFDDRSLPGKSKDEFSNEVILDDVVSSVATTLSLLLKRKDDYSITETAFMDNDGHVDVSS
nr:hypothetical protein [Tanacetum cinerariifolium]